MSNFLALFKRKAKTPMNASNQQSNSNSLTTRESAELTLRDNGAVADPRGGSNRLSIKSIVDSGVTIAGSIACNQSILIDGVVEGDVTVDGDGHVAVIRETARVHGSIDAHTVLVAGTIDGNIKGQTTRLFRTAVVHGTIHSRHLGVDPGASIDSERCLCGEPPLQPQRAPNVFHGVTSIPA